MVDDKRNMSAISGRHRQYKAGTQRFINWLAQTASTICDLSACLNSLQSTLDAKRPVSKAPVIKVSTRELVDLAKIVAGSKPTIAFPANICAILEDVIEARQKCHDFYAAQTANAESEITKQNNSHAHFIKTLRKVLRILAPLYSETASASTACSASSKTKSAQATAPKSLRNRFEQLELEEPSAVSTDDARSFTPNPSEVVLETQEFALSATEDDTAFALWCHLEDMDEIRTFINQQWIDVSRGSLSIDVAGVITDIALEMVERENECFASAHKEAHSWKSLMKHLGLKVLTHANLVYVLPEGHVDTAVMDAKRSNMMMPAGAVALDALLARAGEVMNTFFGGLWSKSSGVPAANASLSTTPRCAIDFERLIAAMLPHIVCQVFSARVMSWEKPDRTPRSVIYGDVLLDGIARHVQGQYGLQSQREPPLWLVFACQVHMDVHKTLNGQVHYGGKLLQQFTRHAQDVVSSCLNLQKNIFQNRPQGDEQMVRLQALAEKAFKLEQLSSRREDGLPNDLGALELPPPFNLPNTAYLTLPSYAGVCRYRIKLDLYDQGTDIANDEGIPLIFGHLYKAGKKYGLITAEWDDMNFVASQHDSKNPFITKTKASADPYAMLRHYLVDLGVDAKAFANGAVPPMPSTADVNAKAKRLDVKVSEFRATFIQCEKERKASGLDTAVSKTLDMVLRVLKARDEDNKKNKGNKQVQYTPIDLLTTLKTHLIADEPRINFDYIGFSRTWILVFRDMVRASGLDVRLYPCCVDIAHALLKGAAEAEANSQAISRTPLGKAMKVLQTAIEKDGKRYSKAAWHQSTGHIPQALVPDFGERVGLSSAREDVMRLLPGASIGLSEDVVEVYDPSGTEEQFEWLKNTPEMVKLMEKSAMKAGAGLAEGEL